MGLKSLKTRSWRRRSTVAAAGLLIVAMAACGSDKPAATATKAPAAQPATAPVATKTPAATGGKVSAMIVDFKHADITAKVGDTITWTNNGSASHTVTAGMPGSVGSVKSGTISPGATFSHTVKKPGEFDYFCEFHSSMVAKVTVTQ